MPLSGVLRATRYIKDAAKLNPKGKAARDGRVPDLMLMPARCCDWKGELSGSL